MVLTDLMLPHANVSFFLQQQKYENEDYDLSIEIKIMIFKPR